jgi:hypothetical protein
LEDRGTEVANNGRVTVFLPTDKPTFSDYLNEAQNDVMGLLPILQMTLRNETNHEVVWNELRAASIDLAAVNATAERLNAIDARRYPLNKAELKAILALG